MLEDSFIENTAIEAKASQKVWHILVVDDDKEVHAVTRLALRDMRFENGRVEIVSAYSAQEARALLTKERRNRFAIAIVDVVMETTTAGLDLVKFIRDDINNAIVRIYLRTGQPGHAPERVVIDGYDINGYHAKAELTAQALYTSVLAALRSYRDLVAIERGRRGLECILRSSQSLLGFANMGQFASSALEQLTALIHVENDAVYVGQSGLTVIQASDDYRILAGIGEYREALGRTAWEVLPAHVVDRLRRAERSGEAITGENWIAVKAPSGDANALLHLDIDRQLDDVELNLINVFAQQTGLAFANVRLTEEILETQRQIVYVLSESIEARSRETGNHIRRVAKTAALLA
jgi:response regulator RpfG family c-di-GMP phosphodiesterase